MWLTFYALNILLMRVELAVLNILGLYFVAHLSREVGDIGYLLVTQLTLRPSCVGRAFPWSSHRSASQQHPTASIAEDSAARVHNAIF